VSTPPNELLISRSRPIWEASGSATGQNNPRIKTLQSAIQILNRPEADPWQVSVKCHLVLTPAVVARRLRKPERGFKRLLDKGLVTALLCRTINWSEHFDAPGPDNLVSFIEIKLNGTSGVFLWAPRPPYGFD
jgi:hypothetical protein